MKCPACGVLHVEKKKFCDYCGIRLAKRPYKGLVAAFAIMVMLFLGSYLFTTRALSIHEKNMNDKSARPLTAASATAVPAGVVKNSVRPTRSIGADSVTTGPAAKIEKVFVAQADDQPAASPVAAAPDPHVPGQTESSFKLMRDPLNAEK